MAIFMRCALWLPAGIFAGLSSIASASDANAGVYSTPIDGDQTYHEIVTHLDHDPSVPPYGITHIKAFQRTDRVEATLTLRHTQIVYVEADNGVGGLSRALVQRITYEPRPNVRSRSQWQSIWADTGGGAGTCAVGAAHYRWAVDWLSAQHADPQQLAPSLGDRAQTYAQRAPDAICTGELSGGAMPQMAPAP